MLPNELLPLVDPLHDAFRALVNDVFYAMLPILGNAGKVVEKNLLGRRHREYGSRSEHEGKQGSGERSHGRGRRGKRWVRGLRVLD